MNNQYANAMGVDRMRILTFFKSSHVTGLNSVARNENKW